MALDPQDTEGLEDETVAAWSVAEDVMIGVMAAAAMRAARKPNVRVAAQQEWARTVNPRVVATASGLVADAPAMVDAATEQAAIRGATAAAQEATTVRPAAPRHRATLPGSGTRTSTGGGTTATPTGTSPSRRIPRPMTLPRTRPQVPGGTTPPPVRPGKAAAEATGRALDKAARQVPRNAKNAWDRIINDAVNRTVAGELTIEQAMQQAMDQAAKEGIGFYRDSRGRKWGLDTYSEMAIRTGTNQALRDAHAAELLAQGIDLVIVSSHSNPAPVCAPYEQKVLSLTGEHPNGRQTIDGQSVTVTASIAEAEANGLHHPNCRHTHTAYLPGFTEPLPVADDPGHEGYKATQQQRYYEREIRRSQRMEAAATTPEARAKAAARRRAYEAKLAAHRKQWDLPRRRHREQFRGPTGGAAAAGRTPRNSPTPTPSPVANSRGGAGASAGRSHQGDSYSHRSYTDRITTTDAELQRTARRARSTIESALPPGFIIPRYRVERFDHETSPRTGEIIRPAHESTLRGRTYLDEDRITINPTMQGQELTMVHEIGHLIDYNLSAEQRPHVHAALSRIRESRTYQSLASFDQTRMSDLRQKAYLMDDRELFARAFSQWVAEESGKPGLTKALGFHLDADGVDGLAQWPHDDFVRYVKPAMDDLFRGM